MFHQIHHIYDAHNHLHLKQTDPHLKSTSDLLKELRGAALMSTQPPDWQQAHDLALKHSNTRVLFGIHPWFAHLYAKQIDWIDTLRKRLLQTPSSAIGEIGLDKQWRPPELGWVDYESQLKVFKIQLALAAELSLPVSVHCVHAQGDLQNILASAPRLPPSIYLHAFGGARGTVEQLIKAKKYGDRLYFGFATCINLKSSKGKEAIQAVPADRLVVESDRSSAEIEGRIERELLEMLSIYAKLKHWHGGIEEAAIRTAENAHRLYAPADAWIRG